MKAHTLPGALDAAAVTRSPVWPGNGTAAQVRPVSRHATGRARVDANAQAFRVPVAVTAVMPGRLRPWVVLTMRHDGAAAPLAGAPAGRAAAAAAPAGAEIAVSPPASTPASVATAATRRRRPVFPAVGRAGLVSRM